jgi:hypothetical protein
MKGYPGGPAEVMGLQGMGRRGLRESKGLANEVMDWLKSQGHTGINFEPLADSAASPEARIRLFEYLLGRKAAPTGGNAFQIPFE